MIVDAQEQEGIFGVAPGGSDVGLRDRGLLESALDRQCVGAPYALKYDTRHSNAATLGFGICKNHAFHDGNKRTALVATIAHMDRNGLLPCSIDFKTLTNVMVNVAAGRLPLEAPAYEAEGGARHRKRRQRRGSRVAADEQVIAAFSSFLERNSRMVVAGRTRGIRYRELRRILARFGMMVGELKGNRAQVMKQKRGFFGVERWVHVTTIGWPGDSREVRPGALSKIRQSLHLTEHDGVDEEAFVSGEDPIDAIINEYRGVLRRLKNK